MSHPATPTGREPSGGADPQRDEYWAGGVDDVTDADVTDDVREGITDDVRAPLPPAEVTAVVVAHNGARWLPDVLAALRDQTRPADRVVAVDTGSRDDSAALLRAALGADAVLVVDKASGFGAAVAAGVAAADRASADLSTARRSGDGGSADGGAAAEAPHRWLWLLHDDCAPAADALEALLRATAADSDVAVVGPKVRGWSDRRLLLEAGVTIARSGRRETGLERGEVDQGQHDDVGEVLAVSSAGMLVRRDAWDAVGGFDPALPLFRDDVDLGWRVNLAGFRVAVAPAAVVHHVGAASSGRRTVDAATRRRHLLDRRSALHVLLANLPARALPWAYLRLAVATVLRTVGFALAKLPGAAVDEVVAAATVLGRPDRVLAARRARRVPPVGVPRDAAALLAPRGAQLHRNLEALAAVATRSTHVAADTSARGRHAVETGPADDELQDLEPVTLRWLRGMLRPGPLLILGLCVLTAVACRGLVGSGRLMEGALLPAPDGARDLWRAYLASWHDVGLGSDAVAPPYLAVLAGVASLLAGSAPLAVDLLVLGSVPLAGLTAWVALARLVQSPVWRAWAAGTYALLPATTGAIAGGRLGTVVAVVVLPLVAHAAVRSLSSWPAAWAGGLALSVAAAFVPLSCALVVPPVLVLGSVAARSMRQRLRLLPFVVTPPLLLLPWSLELLREPGLLLREAGLPGPGLADPALPPGWVLLQSSGGPGSSPWWLGVPLVVGALAALLSRHRRRTVAAGWALVVTGLAVGVPLSFAAITSTTSEATAAAWPGLPVAVVAAGLILATAVGAEQAGDRLTRRSFGWRQPVAVAVAVVTAAAPVLLAGWWVLRGADDPLVRRSEVVLPDFVAAEGDDPTLPRTLVLRRLPDESIRYALVRGSGPRVGDAETSPPDDRYGDLDEAVADLVSGRGGDDAGVLTDYAVQYLLVAAPVDEDLAAVIDAVPGLRRVTTSAGEALWRLDAPAARLRMVAADGSPLGALPAEREGAHATVPAGEAGRVAILAEASDDSWVASVGGERLATTDAGGWAQAFALPAAGGQLELAYDNTERTRWLVAQLLLAGLVVVLAMPGARRDGTDS